MHLRDQDIAKFQALYLKRFGTEIPSDKARADLALLVIQVQIVYRPITREQQAQFGPPRNESTNAK
jgi:hypothetical protein